MSITGKSFLSLRKQDVKEQKSLALGFKKLVFAHKATLGDATINLSSLIIPTEMSSVGFTNPASAEILAAQVYFYRKNLTLISSLKGVLMDYVSYDVTSSSSISFRDFTAEDGEIFIGIIDPVAITGNQIVDAAPLIATGTVAENYTDFNVGQLFEVNKYSTQQVGSVIVYKDGKQQFRNTGNSSTVLDGNYYEVDNGSGSGTIIRFNTAAPYGGYNVLVVSNGLLVYSPDSSALQQIESIAGQIDAMIPTLADLAGVPETNFQSAPNNADLKAFGDEVINHESRITDLENFVYARYTSSAGQSIPDNSSTAMTFNSKTWDSHNAFNMSTGVFTAPIDGWYLMIVRAEFSANGTGVRVVDIMANTSVEYGMFASGAVGGRVNNSCQFWLNAGQTMKAMLFQTSGGALSLNTSTSANVISISRIGG